MNVGQAAKRTGLSVKTIHYYESIGLMIANRKVNGYRDYDEALVHKLAFVQRARGLGFAIDECRALLSLYEDRSRASKDVLDIAQLKLKDIERKLHELQSLHDALSHLVNACQGDEHPHCPILEGLAGER
ncbi:MAG: MerR family copper efflux transcriptional regulator [Gammaproteobacteria bacterium]|jgi:MerR family copper efflux transcriptional regulator